MYFFVYFRTRYCIYLYCFVCLHLQAFYVQIVSCVELRILAQGEVPGAAREGEQARDGEQRRPDDAQARRSARESP